MHDLISVSVVPLATLFSDAYQFKLPYFQRAYAWRTQDVGRLLSDIVDAMRGHEGQRAYFLGKLMVAKSRSANGEAALVDGHQRVMSLTILFAVLRDLESDPKLQARLDSFIRGHDVRLRPQTVMADFCARFVQAPGATSFDPPVDSETLSESERNIIENRNTLRAELSGDHYTPEIRRGLIGYLAERCCVIVSSLEDEDEAWNLLRTEEETRVDFSKADRAKFSLLAIVPRDERAACQRIWETSEAALGAEDMHALLGHIRLLKRRRLSAKPIEIDIADTFKLNTDGAGLDFLDRLLRPAAERLAMLRQDTGNAVWPFAERCRWIDPQLWVPAALLWLEKPRDPEETLLFFKRLERLVWMMRIAGFDPTKQNTRIIHLLGEIDRGVAVSRMMELEVTARIRDTAISNLRSASFDAKHYAGRVLRRISIALGQDPGPIDRRTVTIEHILPRGFTPKSGWRTHFPSRDTVQRHTHRLGNLTFLAPGDNQQADTLGWEEKKPILARSGFVLSKHAAEEREWTPERILARTETLIGVLLKDWEIPL